MYIVYGHWSCCEPEYSHDTEETFESFMELLGFMSRYLTREVDCDIFRVDCICCGNSVFSDDYMEFLYNALDGKFVPRWETDNDNNMMFHANKTTWLKPDGTEHIWQYAVVAWKITTYCRVENPCCHPKGQSDMIAYHGGCLLEDWSENAQQHQALFDHA